MFAPVQISTDVTQQASLRQRWYASVNLKDKLYVPFVAQASIRNRAPEQRIEQFPYLRAWFAVYAPPDPLYNYQRPFATPVYGTTNFAGVIKTGTYASGSFVGNSNGFYFLDPSLSAPKAGATLTDRGYTGPFNTAQILSKFNLAQYVTMLIPNEKRIGTLSFSIVSTE